MTSRRVVVMALGVFAAAHAYGGTIVSVTGPVTSNAAVASPDPFGGYDYAAASWTLTTAYSDVSVIFLGDAVFSTATGTAYLTTSFGPGTTLTDQIASAAFTVPFGPSSTPVTLFSGLDLPAGTYYVTLAADPGDQIGWNVSDIPTITTGPGATVNPGMGCFNGSSPSPYPPSTAGPCVMDNLLYQVTGAAGVPEPGTLSMLLVCGLAGLLLRRRPGSRSS